MNHSIVIIAVVLALGVVVVRSRGLALLLVTVQSALFAAVATRHAIDDPSLLLATTGLWVRTVAIAVVLGIGAYRTREPRPVPAGIEPMTRAVIALVIVLALGLVLPPLGVAPIDIERGAMALLVLGVVIAMTRRATILQILGIVVADNAATLLALSTHDTVPTVIELGVAFDLLMVAVVATAFHSRIFGAFGSGDTRHLGDLSD